MADAIECTGCGSWLRPSLPDGQTGIFAGRCPTCNTRLKFKSVVAKENGVTESSTISFVVDGKKYTVDNPDPLMTLNEFLRDQAGVTSTKRSCNQGGCGCCVVLLTFLDPASQKTVQKPANSCLHPLCATDGMIVTTTRGIGSKRKGYSKIQKALAEHWGSQCGVCSPGMVMSMYSLLQDSSKTITAEDVELALDGNICRCTGYRPILDAFKSLVPSADSDIEDTHAVAATPCKQLDCGKVCQGTKGCNTRLKAVGDGHLWLRPTSTSDLQDMLKQYSGSDYMLVCGNTSTGIYQHDDPKIKIDISRLDSLSQINVGGSSITLGACVSIASLLTILKQNASKSQSFSEMILHINKVANTPVRALGSWAGNVALALEKSDFPSDLFTIFAGAQASVTVTDSDGNVTKHDLLDLVGTSMQGKYITQIEIPFCESKQTFKSFKAMLRHVNCHAYVNASFLFDLDDDNKVTGTPRLIFGGVAPHAIQAQKTAALLSGKSITSQDTLTAVMQSLANEIQPDSPPAAASAAYRQFLVQALTYKAMLAMQPSVPPRLQSAATHYKRALSSGKQSYKTDPSEYPVSQAMPKLAAYEQAAGEAIYIDDVPMPSNTLHAAFVVATVANATLSSIDDSEARELPGVQRVITAVDFPSTGGKPFTYYENEPILVSLGQTVEYAGQGIAIVVATSHRVAIRAANLVKATYTNKKQPIVTLDDAVKASSFFKTTDEPIKSGEDIDKALSECAATVSGVVSCGSQYHFYMETQTCAALPCEDGGLRVMSATQSLTDMQNLVSQLIGLPGAKVRLELKRMGGAYGGKIDRCWMTAAAAGYLAYALECPVKCVLPLDTNMHMIGKRHPFRCDYTVGVDKDNKLHAVKMTYYADAGAYQSGSDGTMSQAMTTCDACYFCPNWLVEPKICKTNTPSNTATRAPGCAPAVFFMEMIMDHLAHSLNVDPADLRKANLYQKNQVTPYGMQLQYCSISDLWSSFLDSSSYQDRLSAVNNFNKANRWRKRGISIAPNKYGLGWDGYNLAAHVAISQIDGSVSVLHGACESGQGCDVKVAQAVAYKLGIDISLITVEAMNTPVIVNNTTTGGSSTSEIACSAAVAACKVINDRLAPIKKKLDPKASWQDIIHAANQDAVDLAARGWAAPTHPGVFLYNSYGMVCTEVELDVLTGEVEILRVDILFDCGVSLNPAVDIGQVEGALMMGLGYYLTEKINYDTDGQLLQFSTWEYKPFSVKDIPIDLRVTLLPDAPNPVGFMRSKASGEPPLCMASNVLSALRMAVNAARQETQSQLSFIPVHAPWTPEQLVAAAQVDASQFSLK